MLKFDPNLKQIAIPVALVLLILVGMVMANAPGMYNYDIEFTESDGEVTVSFDSNTVMETTSVKIANSGMFRIEYVAAYVDPDYAALNDWDIQIEMFEDMKLLLDVRGVDGFGVYDSEGLLKFMETADPGTTAVFIASGSVSDILYDGTYESPLVTWLERGGVLVNMSGCLGKYVSHGSDSEDIEEISGYGALFASVDDECFYDSETKIYADYECNEDFQKSLHFYMNECTYGISMDVEDSLSIGYHTEDGVASALLFRSFNGMVMNFGVSLSTHEHSDHYVAQIIASGTDYLSEIVETQVGDTRDCPKSSFTVDESCSIYAFIGSTRAVYAERFDFSPGESI